MLESPGSALRNCDGFGGVSSSGDGVLRAGRGVDVVGRMEPSFEHSIAYCDRALLVLDEYPQYWVRRISVMQSRAMHRLIAADADGAIEDLDSADALAPEPLNADYVRTLDVNARLIRALALTMKGEHAAGEALALEARLQRPYARAVLVAALMVLSQRGEPAPMEPVLAELARLDPQWRRAGPTARPLTPGDLRAFFMLMLDPDAPERRAEGGESSRSLASMERAREINRRRCGAGPPPGGSLLQVCDFSRRDTGVALEERVLYQAAQATIAQGASHFVIEARRDISHWAVSPYSRINDQSGYESVLTFRAFSDNEGCASCISAIDIVRDLDRYAPQADE
jgi:hypothetical protein